MEKIVLRGIGNNEIAVIKDIRDLMNIDLNQAKDIADVVKDGDELELTVRDAKFAVGVLSSSGADAYELIETEIKKEEDSILTGDLLTDLKKFKEVFQNGVDISVQKKLAQNELMQYEENLAVWKSAAWGMK